MTDDAPKIIPFGKHRGSRVEPRIRKAKMKLHRKKLTDAEVEIKAKELWGERERHIWEMFGIRSTPWEHATEKGRDLMRNQARAGKNSWLDETPKERRERKRREKTPPPDLRVLFQGLLQDAQIDADVAALAHVTEQYMHRWFEDWLYQRRTLDENTWLRDISIVAWVFCVQQRWKYDLTNACRIVAQAYEKKLKVDQPQIEKIVHEHAKLIESLTDIAKIARGE